jgi:hypothetical protein
MSSQAPENSCRACNISFIPDFVLTDHNIPAAIVARRPLYPFGGNLALFFQFHPRNTQHAELGTNKLALFFQKGFTGKPPDLLLPINYFNIYLFFPF